MKTLNKGDTQTFELIKEWKPYEVKGKTFIIVVEQEEEKQVEIISPKDNKPLKMTIDDDIEGECEICIKEVDGEDTRTIYEEYFIIK